MLDHRPVTQVIGTLLVIEGGFMMIPGFCDLYYNDPNAFVFIASALLTLFIGLALTLASRGRIRELTIRQAFLISALSWVIITAFGALPLYLSSPLEISFTDAYFETMSGITTTGSTVLSNLDDMTRGVLLWRSLLQWLGGIGIIVMALAVLPLLQIGGMQIFRAESFDTAGRILPKTRDIAGRIMFIYLFFTLICAIAYNMAGMTGFEAINHALTTISTGGYSTSDSSMGYFDNPTIELICIIFMILGSLPFSLYVYAILGQPGKLFTDSQVLWFLSAVTIFTLLAVRSQEVLGHEASSTELRDAAFSVVSVMTGTGYATVDYSQWSPFAVTLFFCIMFVGGCAGSTSCGVKIFRFQVIFIAMKQRLFHIIYPHGTYIAKYQGKTLESGTAYAVMSFLFVFLVLFSVISVTLSLLGLDPLTAMSATATCISNVGPGFGNIVGPAGNFAPLPDSVKWILSFTMLLGRLELFPVLVLFLPRFWRF